MIVITTVRQLFNNNKERGYLTGTLFSIIKKGEFITIGNKKFECVLHTSKQIRFKNENSVITGKKFYHSDNKNQKDYVFYGNYKWEQFSRDIEGIILIDLLNENNQFHNFSFEYLKLNEYLKSKS